MTAGMHMAADPLTSATVCRSPRSEPLVGGQVWLTLADGRDVGARSALAFPYRLVRGDEVVVIANGVERYVIGVLSGRGPSEWSATDLSIRSEGKLRLKAGRAVRLRSRKLLAMADKRFVVAVGRIHKQSRQLRQRVAETLRRVTQDADQRVDERYQVQARHIAAKVKEIFFINGETIRLD